MHKQRASSSTTSRNTTELKRKSRVDVLSKEVAIATLGVLLKALSGNSDPNVLKEPLKGLTDILEHLDDNELYSDWYPSATHAEENVNVSNIETSTCANFHTGEDALSRKTRDNEETYHDKLYWLSKKQASTNTWTACVPKSRKLSSVKFAFEEKFRPESVTLSIREEESSEWIEEIVHTVDADTPEDECVKLNLKSPRQVHSFQLKLTDFNRSNTNQQHTLSKVQVRCTHKLNKAIMPVHNVLNMLQSMAVNVIGNTNSDVSLCNEAIRSLCALVRTTGSMSHLLNLLKALLSLSSSFTLDDAAASSARRLTNALLDRFYDNAAFILAEEDTLAVGDTSCTNETKNAMQTLLFESDVKISLESSGGQVISVTKNGLVIAPRARNLGPNELLILKECEDGWAFQTSQNKLLGLGNSSDILEEKIDVEEEEAEQKDEEPTSHVIATKASPVTSKETWSVVREGQYILLRGQNEQYVTIGSVGGVISCDAVNRAQATKFRVLLRTTEFEDFKTYVRARVPLKRAGSVFLCDLKSVRVNSSTQTLEIGDKIMGGEAPQSLQLMPPSNGIAFVEYDVPKNLKSARLEVATTLVDSAVSSETALDCIVRVNESAVWSCSIQNCKDGLKRPNLSIVVKGGDRLRLEVICSGPNTKAAKVAWLNPQLIPLLDGGAMERKMKKCSGENWGRSPLRLASTLLEISGSMAENSIKAMHLSCGERDADDEAAHDIAQLVPSMKKAREFACLSIPYVLLVRGQVLVEIHDLIEKLLKNKYNKEGDILMTVNALKMLEANLSWLLISKIDPEEVGVSMKSKKETLSNTLRMLEELIQNKQQDVDKTIVQQATQVWDAGLELFFPTREARESLAKSASEDGVVVEMQFQFPTQLEKDEDSNEFDSGDGTDVRFERLMLMLRLECTKNSWKHELIGKFHFFVYLVMSIPKESASQFLSVELDRITKLAGFKHGWEFPVGIRNPPVKLKIERYLAFDRRERLRSEYSVGCVRLYSRSVGTFNEVCSRVSGFVKSV